MSEPIACPRCGHDDRDHGPDGCYGTDSEICACDYPADAIPVLVILAAAERERDEARNECEKLRTALQNLMDVVVDVTDDDPYRAARAVLKASKPTKGTTP